MHIAAYRGKVEVVRLLLSQPGLDINTADNDGDSPLSGAKEKGHTEIVEMLKRAGAE